MGTLKPTAINYKGYLIIRTQEHSRSVYVRDPDATGRNDGHCGCFSSIKEAKHYIDNPCYFPTKVDNADSVH